MRLVCGRPRRVLEKRVGLSDYVSGYWLLLIGSRGDKKAKALLPSWEILEKFRKVKFPGEMLNCARKLSSRERG
jgi:hypothetical protein